MRQLLNEMLKVNEEEDLDLGTEEAPSQELTPEMMAHLVEQMPELAEVDQEELEKGIKVEMEHFDTVSGDMLQVAKIALDHIKETPQGKSYYDALAQMEHELQETPGEEEAEHAGSLEVEAPAVDVPMEKVEEKVNESQEQHETATNEEAQEMIDKGEAEIPEEAVIENPEK